jgi:adenylate cyclase
MAIQCHEALGDRAGALDAARTAVARIEKVVAAEPDNGAALADGAKALVLLGQTDRAKAWAEHALLLDPDDGRLRYNLACAMVAAGETDYGLDLLGACLAKGGQSILMWTRVDNDFDSVREHPRFMAMLAAGEARFADVEIKEEATAKAT